MIDLALVWAGLLSVSVLLYVVMDGFDLGIGLLFPWLNVGDERDRAMNSIAPVWDGNETWLVLGGGGLFAAFPLAYGVLMTAFYAPLIAMLLGLVFRGVAFEFRWRDPAHRALWDISFTAGSLMAAFCQGLILGAFVQGIEVDNRAYAGGWFDWLTPFSVLTGVAVSVGYGLLGAAWLILKSDGGLRDRAYRLALPLAVAMLGLIAVVSLWTPVLSPEIASRWFSWPNIAVLWPIPFVVMLLGGAVIFGLRKKIDALPFGATLGLFMVSYMGLTVSLFPYVVPRSLTVWQAAAPDSSLSFLLVGTSILLPMILAYTAYAYWVFRGKLKAGEGYH
ncbi:MAG: cytochrome d ubiquinol oxidase subunit II [Lysobacterales bacterium]